MLIAIDPGKAHCGVALFDDRGTLIQATCIRAEDPKGSPAERLASLLEEARCLTGMHPEEIFRHSVRQVVVEEMEYHPNRDTSHPNDLLAVQWMGATLGGVLHNHADGPIPVPARVWKKQVPKKIHHPRILAKLSAVERDAMDSKLTKKFRTDMLDAIGIGLWKLGR
jgi:hypothetical protein